MNIKIGFLVNPIAGIGGKRAWKGTDDIEEAWEIFDQGEKYSYGRVKKALSSISPKLPITFFFCANPMGEEILNEFSFQKELVYTPKIDHTNAPDTKSACRIFLEKKVDLILFVGGDGTARDVSSVVGQEIAVLGIPSGVKMFSGCFLYRPEDLGEIIQAIFNEDIYYAPEDVLDVNEELFRENKVQSSLFGQIMVPQKAGLIQGGKVSSSAPSDEDFEAIADEVVDEEDIMNGLVVLGTGSTVYHVLRKLGIEKTLLGVDVLNDGKLTHTDVDEEQLYNITKDREIRVVLTPIGGQGFVLGRGNQQISSRVLKGAKSIRLILVATEKKLETIDRIEIDIDKSVEIPQIKNGFIQIIVSYHIYKLKKLNIEK